MTGDPVRRSTPARPRRIVHVVGEDAYGVAGSVAELLGELAQRGHDVRLVVYGRGEEFFTHSRLAELAFLHHVSVAPLPRWCKPRALFRVPDLVRLHRTLRRSSADLIHCHDLFGLLAALPLRILCRAPVVATVHGLIGPGDVDEGVYRALAAAASRTVVLKDADRRAVSRMGGSGRAVSVANGIDADRWARSVAACDDLRCSLAIPQDAFVIGLVGRLSAEKRQDAFLTAMRGYNWTCPVETHILVAGEGPLSARIVEASRDGGFERHVHPVGYCPDIARVYKTLDVLVLPSSVDSQPMVVLEAMACGVPVVATAVGAVPQMLEKGAGRLVLPGRLDLLPKLLSELRDDPGSRRALTLAGRCRIKERFDIRIVANDYEERLYGPLWTGREMSS